MKTVVLMAVFLAVTTGFFLLMKLVGVRRSGLLGRLQVQVGERAKKASPDESAPATKRDEGFRLLRRANLLLARVSLGQAIASKLKRANLKLHVAEFLFLDTLAAAIAFGIMYLITTNVIVLLIAAGLGFYLPWYWLKVLSMKRLKALCEQLPDSLDIVANSLRSGYSFMQALDTVAREMAPPIASEFARVIRECQVGFSLEDALGNLVERVDSDDLDLVITAVLIQRQVGGSLSEVLEKISHTIRERVRIAGEVRTLTTQGRISGYVVSLIPIILVAVIYMIDPGFVSVLFTHPFGRVLVFIGVLMQMVGISLVRKIVDFDF